MRSTAASSPIPKCNSGCDGKRSRSQAMSADSIIKVHSKQFTVTSLNCKLQTVNLFIQFRKNVFGQTLLADGVVELGNAFELIISHCLLGNAQPIGDLFVGPSAHEQQFSAF